MPAAQAEVVHLLLQLLHYGFLETGRRIPFYKEERPQRAEDKIYPVHARHEPHLYYCVFTGVDIDAGKAGDYTVV